MARFLYLGTSAFLLGVLTASAQQPAAPNTTVGYPVAPRGEAVAALAPPPLRGGTPAVLPGTRGNAFVTIQGNALNSTNGPMPNGLVRLRDARLGRVVNTQLTDQS